MVAACSDHEFELLLDEVRAAFSDLGVDVDVREETIALTASIEGGILTAVFLSGPAAFVVRFCQLVAEDTHATLKKKIAQLRDAGRGDLIVCEHEVEVVIEPDLPYDAITQLLEAPLPPAPSGRLVYDRLLNRWRDET